MRKTRSSQSKSFSVRIIARASLAAGLGALVLAGGCADKPKPYGTETSLLLPGKTRQVWAIAPAIDLSGQSQVDPLLQADLLYAQLQQVHGLTVIPVNRVAQIYASLKIDKVQSASEAMTVCELLGCDGLIVPTVTAYDPYNPPKFGGSLQLFMKSGTTARQANVDVYALARAPEPDATQALPPPSKDFVQAVGMFDAANGSVREAVLGYARGRNDPLGPMGEREYLMNMDRYVGFAYHALIEDLLRDVEARQPRAGSGQDRNMNGR